MKYLRYFNTDFVSAAACFRPNRNANNALVKSNKIIVYM